jgi:ABC-2 type transport system ATP-binding protein
VTGQSTSVDEQLSAVENLVLFGMLLGLGWRGSRRRAADLLEAFDLGDAATRQVSKYSGGMRRRLDLAASLIVRPPLIFLDEPTTGLDPRTRGQMWTVIRGLVRDGSTVLLTTQYLDEADQLADRIAVIDRGRVVAEGTADELKASVGSASLHLRLGDVTRTAAALEVIAATLGAHGTAVPSRSEIAVPMADPDRVTDLLVAMRGRDIGLTEMSVRKPTLDEVFLAITGHGVETDDTPADEENAA